MNTPHITKLLRVCLPLLAAPWALGTAQAQALDWLKPYTQVVQQHLPAAEPLQSLLLSSPALAITNQQAALLGNQAQLVQQTPYEWQAQTGLANRRIQQNNTSVQDLEVGISKGLRLPEKTRIREAQAQNLQQGAQVLKALGLHQLRLEFASGWLECQRQYARLDRIRTLGELANALQAQQSKRLQAGEVSALEAEQTQLLQSQLALEANQALTQSRLAEQQLQLRFPVLLQVLGTTACGYAASPREATGTASDSTPSPAELDELNTADPNLQLQTLQTQQLSQEARYAQADQTPDPTVGLRMAQEQNNAERIVGLQLSIPLSGQLRQAQTRLAQQTFAVADQSLRVVQQEQRLQLQQLFINLPALRIQAERLGQLAVRSRAALTKAERAFRLGESNITEITLLKQQHLRVELDAVDAHYTWLQSQVRLWALQEAAKLNNETTVKAQ